MRNASIATGLAVAALSFVSSAHAGPIYQNLAGITQARNGSDEQYIKRDSTGVSNTHATLAKQVVITPPRSRIDESASNVRVRIHFNKTSQAAFTCTVELRDQNGRLLTSRTPAPVPAGNTGSFTRTATFSQNEVDVPYGAIVVSCTLPAAGGVTLREVRVL